MLEKRLTDYFNGKRVLLTGDSGFKGSWMAIWLNELGAEVHGYSLDPPSHPNNFNISKLYSHINGYYGDVRNFKQLEQSFKSIKPEVVIHMAAQSLVLESYKDPYNTFETNVMGTVNVLELIRRSDYVRAGLIVTSDKCYENPIHKIHEFREDERMGGNDPYSASKGVCELVMNSYLRSFFNSNSALANVASVRAGNVIGGGDFAENRIVPDCFKALINNEKILIRNPNAVRPWQFVLEPVGGYLTLAAHLLTENGRNYSGGWNFGPRKNENCNVLDLSQKIIKNWGSGEIEIAPQDNKPHEASYLALNCDKSRDLLGWSSVYDVEEAVKETTEWFNIFAKNNFNMDFSFYNHNCKQIQRYSKKARENGMNWF